MAIKYDNQVDEAPRVLAKGADYMAQRIKEIARDNGVAVIQNKPLARSLYATAEVGENVPPELYELVAEVLVSVYQANGRIEQLKKQVG